MVWEEIKSRVWSPEQGEELIGVFLEVESPEEAHGKLYHFDVKDKGLVSVWGCAMLDSKMSQVKKAEVVKLSYHGKIRNSKGQLMHDYSVYRQKQESKTIGLDLIDEEEVVL